MFQMWSKKLALLEMSCHFVKNSDWLFFGLCSNFVGEEHSSDVESKHFLTANTTGTSSFLVCMYCLPLPGNSFAELDSKIGFGCKAPRLCRNVFSRDVFQVRVSGCVSVYLFIKFVYSTVLKVEQFSEPRTYSHCFYKLFNFIRFLRLFPLLVLTI